MNRWTVRVVGVLLLLMFALVFVQMHSSLRRIQQQQQHATPAAR
jgi:hypothetical protein